jgi:hypothetical protein
MESDIISWAILESKLVDYQSVPTIDIALFFQDS